MPPNTVPIEVDDLGDAFRLAQRLAPGRKVTLHEYASFCLLTVELKPSPGDLAVLLRQVERFVAEEGLPAIRYEVDGRSYELTAA